MITISAVMPALPPFCMLAPTDVISKNIIGVGAGVGDAVTAGVEGAGKGKTGVVSVMKPAVAVVMIFRFVAHIAKSREITSQLTRPSCSSAKPATVENSPKAYMKNSHIHTHTHTQNNRTNKATMVATTYRYTSMT
jgi:hypothetical protein